MSKHIFGFALFSAIVVAFVFIFTVWYAPSIPPKEIVRPPVMPTVTADEKPLSCPLKKNGLSYEVISVEYGKTRSELVSVIKLNWNGAGAPPRKVFVQPRIFTADNYRNAQYLSPNVAVDPFSAGNSKVMRIESRYVVSGAGTAMPNFYVFFDVSEDSARLNRTLLETDLPLAHQVLFVYDDPKPTRTPQGSLIPQ